MSGTAHDEMIERFAALLAALRDRHRWTDITVIRLTALSLATLGAGAVTRGELSGGDGAGCAAHLVERLDEVVLGLKDAARWTEPLASPIRYVLAAMLMRHELEPAAVAQAIRDTLDLLKQHGLKRGSTHAYLAAFLLAVRFEGCAPPTDTIDRMRRTLDCWKEDHPWLTGADDYPMAALHAARGRDPMELSRRVEQTYQALRRAGFGFGDQLQLSTHLLAMGELGGEEAAVRFAAIASELGEQKVSVGRSRYDEVALLALVPGEPRHLVTETLRLRDGLCALKGGLLTGRITMTPNNLDTASVSVTYDGQSWSFDIDLDTFEPIFD
jgi:hypothetical protein